jgi:hypothetical protein
MVDSTTLHLSPRKRSIGCFGLCCVILALPVALVFIMIGLGYEKYGWIQALSSDTGDYLAMPAEGWEASRTSGGNAIALFNLELQNHGPAELKLSADEINALLMTQFAAAKLDCPVQFTFTGDEGGATLTVPSEWVFNGTVKNRYYNLKITFDTKYDASTKSILIDPDTVQLNVPNPHPTSGTSKDVLVPLDPSHVPTVTKIINDSINNALRNDSTGKLILDHATSVKIQNSNLVIEAR